MLDSKNTRTLTSEQEDDLGAVLLVAVGTAR